MGWHVQLERMQAISWDVQRETMRAMGWDIQLVASYPP